MSSTNCLSATFFNLFQRCLSPAIFSCMWSPNKYICEPIWFWKQKPGTGSKYTGADLPCLVDFPKYEQVCTVGSKRIWNRLCKRCKFLEIEFYVKCNWQGIRSHSDCEIIYLLPFQKLRTGNQYSRIREQEVDKSNKILLV